MSDATQTDLTVAQSLTSEAMLTELTARGVLEVRQVCHEPGWLWLVTTEWIEAPE